MVGALNRRTNVQERGPDSFATLMGKEKPSSVEERAKAPQKPMNGKNEAGSRTEKDLSVKRKDSGTGEKTSGSDSSAKTSDDQNSFDKDEPSGSKEHKTEKSEEKIATAKSKRNLSPRQKVMQEFMDSAESEFGIPPEKLVEAMAKLSDNSLLKTPEETASQVISDLKLPPESADKVEARYVQMLSKLTDIENRRPEKMLEPTADQLAMMQAAGGLAGLGAIAALKKGENGEQLMVTVKDRRMLLNDSLAKLSDKFFLSGSESLRAEAGMGNSTDQPHGKLDASLGMNPDLMKDRMNESALANQGLDEKMPVDFTQTRPMPGMNNQIKLSNDGYQDLAAKLAAVGVTAGALNQSIKGDPANRAALKMEQALQGQAGGASSFGGPNGFSLLAGANAVNGNAASAEAGEEFSSFSESGNGSSKDSLDLSSSKGAGEFFVQKDTLVKPEFAAAGISGGALAGKAGMTKAESTENIQQLMNQAQYVIKKGGGEAIVKLNPEGLGEVHLRVTVNEGKVNLQMSAETKEAKNLIESSIKDLQSSLGAHNLKIDRIKVDVGNQSSTEGNLHKQGNFNFDQGREQARQFLNNFQDDNMSNRSNFFESTALKAYNPNKGPEPLKPSPESASSRRYVGEGRGTGLNLVA